MKDTLLAIMPFSGLRRLQGTNFAELFPREPDDYNRTLGDRVSTVLVGKGTIVQL